MGLISTSNCFSDLQPTYLSELIKKQADNIPMLLRDTES